MADFQPHANRPFRFATHDHAELILASAAGVAEAVTWLTLGTLVFLGRNESSHANSQTSQSLVLLAWTSLGIETTAVGIVVVVGLHLLRRTIDSWRRRSTVGVCAGICWIICGVALRLFTLRYQSQPEQIDDPDFAREFALGLIAGITSAALTRPASRGADLGHAKLVRTEAIGIPPRQIRTILLTALALDVILPVVFRNASLLSAILPIINFVAMAIYFGCWRISLYESSVVIRSLGGILRIVIPVSDIEQVSVAPRPWGMPSFRFYPKLAVFLMGDGDFVRIIYSNDREVRFSCRDPHGFYTELNAVRMRQKSDGMV